jgi:hypothetical protein
MPTASEECDAYITEMIPNTNQRKILLGALSRILNSETRDPKKLKTYVFYGTGGNGKSTFMTFLIDAIADGGIVLTEAEITGPLSMELMDRITGKKIVFVKVTAVNSLLPILKVLLSGCRLMCPTFAGSTTRKIYTPTYDIIICIDGTFKPDQRVITMPFNYEYVQNPSPNNPKEKKKGDVSVNFETWSPIFKQKLKSRDF